MGNKLEDRKVHKVMFLIPDNVAGGAERVMTSLCSEFSRRNIDTYFMTFDSESNFYPLDEKVKVLRLNAGTKKMGKLEKYLKIPFIELKRKKRMKQFMKEIRPDVVISFMFMTNLIGWKCCRELGIPIILSERNDPLRYGKKKRKIMKYVYSRADGFVCQSDVVKQICEENYGLDNIVVIYNPIGDDQVETAPVVERKKNIITVGRMIPQKNQAMLIRAFSKLPEEYSDYTLTIYGEGPLRNELEKLVSELDLESRVSLPGVEKNAIKNHRDAALFVLPSDFEGYPNVLAEAMSNGLVSISSDFPSGTAQMMIEEAKNGYLFSVGNEEELVQTIIKALSDEKNYQEIQKECVKLFDQTRLSKIADRWLAYIERVKEEFARGDDI